MGQLKGDLLTALCSFQEHFEKGTRIIYINFQTKIIATKENIICATAYARCVLYVGKEYIQFCCTIPYDAA